MALKDWETEKKQIELLQLERFKKCYPPISDAKIIVEKNDPPDGIIQIENKRISVELTQIFWNKDSDGINKKTQESIADMIMSIAERKYEKLKLPYVQVNVSFNDKYGLKKYGESINLNSNDKESLSDYIVQTVAKYVPLPKDKLFEVPEYNEKWERILHPKIQDIFIEQYSLLTENCWSADGGGVIPTITKCKIDNAIAKKK